MTALEKIGAPPNRLGDTALYDWEYLVQEDRAHRLIYTDPAIFEAEMIQIFGGTWTYLAHESEIPNINDFITRRLGLRPLIIARDAEGKIRALYNRCTHRGTTLCRRPETGRPKWPVNCLAPPTETKFRQLTGKKPREITVPRPTHRNDGSCRTAWWTSEDSNYQPDDYGAAAKARLARSADRNRRASW